MRRGYITITNQAIDRLALFLYGCNPQNPATRWEDIQPAEQERLRELAYEMIALDFGWIPSTGPNVN